MDSTSDVKIRDSSAKIYWTLVGETHLPRLDSPGLFFFFGFGAGCPLPHSLYLPRRNRVIGAVVVFLRFFFIELDSTVSCSTCAIVSLLCALALI